MARNKTYIVVGGILIGSALLGGKAVANPLPGPIASDGTPPNSEDAISLARMLYSETSNYNARVVIGWITIQVARRRNESVTQLLTKGKGYGSQLRGSESFYASTARGPDTDSLNLAMQLLAGEVIPSDEIRSHRPGAWVEQGQGVPDTRLIELQKRWNEGIYGRIRGTRWFLYSSDSKDSPVTSLDSVPEVA